MTERHETTGSSLDAVTQLLDLRPASPNGPEPGRVRLGVVSGRQGPRFLVPLDHPSATPQACLAYLGLRDAKTRVTRGAVGLALRARMSKLVAREVLSADASEGSLIGLLTDLLDDPDQDAGLAVAVGLGHRDEVWKPTLQVFRPDGTPAAFVKVGLGPVGAMLVNTEAEALSEWGAHPDPRLVVPGLIGAPEWRGMPIAVVAPLPLDSRRLPAPVSAWAVRSLDGPTLTSPLANAPWWTERIKAQSAQPQVSSLLEQIQARHGDSEDLSWGRWHGDWVPWNLARCHRGLVAWDWEYSEAGAPVGLDEVHGAYQQARVVEGCSIARALATAGAEAAVLASTATSPTNAASLRLSAGTEAPPAEFGPHRWLADAHVAMLLSRNAKLEQLTGVKPHDRDELLAAAAEAISTGP